MNIGETPIKRDTTDDTPTPTIITISSSEDGLEDDREETSTRENRSKISKPHSKPEKSQDTIAIYGRDQSSHQEITILGNTDKISTPSEIRITTQTPATITIVSKLTNVLQQNDATQPLHKTSTHRDSNNNVQANSKNDLPTQSQESNVPNHQTTTRGRCEGTLH